jgi:hypothetical protein
MKNNKAAGADSIAAELLKTCGPNLVDALHVVIQQAWTSKTLPRSWTEGQGDVIIYAAFQFRGGSYRTTSRPTNNKSLTARML